ncbi:reverse transcriptase domain-containing protein [Tanacetum coccineum]
MVRAGKLYEFHNDKGHSTDECVQLKRQIEELVRAGKLSQFVKGIRQEKDQQRSGEKDIPAKDKAATIYMIQSWQRVIRQKVTQSFDCVREIVFTPLTVSERIKGPLVIEAEIGGHTVHRMYMDGGSSIEILFEHCFNQLRPKIQSHMVPATTSLTGFSGETIWPLGQIRLLVTIEDAKHSTEAWMNFMIVRSPSPYNGIIRRPGIKEIQAVPSTAHEMIKFPVKGGIVTIRSTIFSPMECATVAATPKHIKENAKKHLEDFQVAIHPDFPYQKISIGGTLSTKRRTELCVLLKRNLDIFAWWPANMTGVPRSIAKHKLNIREGYSPIRQKKRGQAPERAKAIQAEVQKLVEAGIMREDCYPLSEIDWKIESLCDYPFKCFLDAYKGYHQIQMAEKDEENTAFHTPQGVYCYTKMPFGLKNAEATYQRLVDKAFDKQVGRNLEVYVDDLVIKSHTKEELLRDIKEMFCTLRKINMKLNPKKCTFGAVEGMFLGYVVGPEGIKPCPDKVDAVLQLPSPRTIKEVQSLNGKLTGLNRFLSKSVEKSLPLATYTCSTKAAGRIDNVLVRLPWSGGRSPDDRKRHGSDAVFAAKNLRRYFQAHRIAVITNQLIKQIISRPDVVGRLQKWSVMLGEHNITYRPRTSIKGQILADFLVEKPGVAPADISLKETLKEVWT